MKILLQLLKEFWLPLIVGIAWTLYNVSDKPPESWTIKELINIFGPTFFFASWLVAQYYRVRKQQRVESGLTDIRSDIHGLHYPLLPCSLFCTLKHKCFPEEVEYAFSDCDGYKKYGPDSVLQPSGSVKMNSVCNPIEHKAEHSHCTVGNQEKLTELEKKSSHVIQKPVSVTVEFFFGKDKKKAPTLVLGSGHSTVIDAFNLELYDDVVYQDTAIRGLLSKNASDNIWNIKHLQDALIKVDCDFWHFHLPGYPIRDETMWPTFHNLQLIFGEKSQNLLSFNLNDLSSQKVEKKANPGIGGDISVITLVFEKKINSEFCEKQLYEIW